MKTEFSFYSILILLINVVIIVESNKNQQILREIDTIGGDQFAYSVSISNKYAIIGSFHDDDNGINSGSAYIFYLNITNGSDYGLWYQKWRWADLILWDARPTQINDVLYFFKGSYLFFN